MKTEKVDQALKQKFVTDGERLVFWHDPNGAFKDYVAAGFEGDLADVQVLNLAQVGGFSAKLLLEQDDTTGKYLVYSQGEMPPAEEDWLFDIRLYSTQFHADMASIWLQQLGLSNLSLRDHLKTRANFFGSQDRIRKLGKLVSPTDDETALDVKMMAVLVGSSLAAPFDVLRALCDDHTQDGQFDLTEPPKIITTFEKMGLRKHFWELMRIEFGYEADTPTVAGLLRRLLVSEFYYQTDGAEMELLVHLLLPAEGRRNAAVYLTQWRDSNLSAFSYDTVSSSVATEQKVNEPLGTYKLETIKDVYTFWEAEKQVVSQLRDRVLNQKELVDVESIAMIVTERKAGHWLSGSGKESPERSAIASAYEAILAAAEIFTLQSEHRKALSYETPGDLFAAYQQDLHHIDRLYRRFSTHARPAERQGWDLLKPLAEEVERAYDVGFLQPLGVAWSQQLDEGFLEKWALQDLPAQQDFYSRNISPHLARSGRSRAFVIISDAFRYEAAGELTERINSSYRLDAELSAMLGVLPSYTALGMASLLPHKTLTYTKKGDVLVDDKPVAGTEQRSKQLTTVRGMACQAKDLRVMKLEEARKFTEGKRVVYIYHNIIDARGENAATEGDTFEAVSECIGELEELVHFCVNKLNAAKVWVTADHGFIFQQSAPDEIDKSKLSHKPAKAIKFKKRYVIGRQLGTTPEGHHGSMDVTVGAEGGMEFWIPRAANRFHFIGGARFIHGGAMPQEVVVPLVTVTQLRGKEKAASRTEKVAVQVLGTNHKITTPIYRFELIQTEAVGERRKPITLRAAIYEGINPVTSIESITFDSTSDSIEARKKTLRLELRAGTFDKNIPYRLVLRDIDNDVEVQSVPVVIDRSFDDDF